MKLHAETLVRDIRSRIVPAEERQRTENEFRVGLQNAWAAGGWAQHNLGTGNTSRTFPFSYLGSFWTALSSLVHYPIPGLEEAV